MRRPLFAASLAAVVAAVIVVPMSLGSSHREAPNIMLDPTADNTDTYAFVSPDAPNALTVVADWIPGENPANGPNFFRFDDRADYYINIDNTGDGAVDVRYLFKFRTVQRNPKSFAYALPPVNHLSDKTLNTFQTYTVYRQTMKAGKVRKGTTVASNVPVAPSNVGEKTMPNYAQLADEAIKPLPNGGKVFAGQRDDPFFLDLGATFDAINVRKTGSTGNQGGGKDDFAGQSIEAVVLQMPTSDVTRDAKPVVGPTSPNAVVGVWASTERRRLQVTSADYNSGKDSRGGNVQVSRLGNPLVNELLDPISQKDAYNRTEPQDDGKNIGENVRNPELAAILNKLFPNLVNAPEHDRTDMVQAILTGIPGLNQITANPAEADTLKINLGIPPTTTPNRFGVLGGDMAGFPNGRRLSDDVGDIDLEVIAGFLKGNKVQLGDGVDVNDKPFLSTFPYMALPTSGFDSAPSQRFEPDHSPVAAGGGPSVPTPSTPGAGTPTIPLPQVLPTLKKK